MTTALDRALTRLPSHVRAQLPDSFEIQHCAVNLWARSKSGPFGRTLSLTESAGKAAVHGKTTVAQAVDTLVSGGLLEPISSVDDLPTWQWLAGDTPPQLSGTRNVPPIERTLLDSAERARIRDQRSLQRGL